MNEGGFSAARYFFGRKIENEIGVPVGLIQDCLGGTPAEAWTSPETLRKLKDFDPALNEVERLRAKGGPEYGNSIMYWYDQGIKGHTWAQWD